MFVLKAMLIEGLFLPVGIIKKRFKRAREMIIQHAAVPLSEYSRKVAD
ncbi:hypothetical protein [Enterobacter cloacae]|nr:hypothetical protein [Enterobacter cloacae]CZW21151.1 Uncharacterised protein [Enterobacter cloacae]